MRHADSNAMFSPGAGSADRASPALLLPPITQSLQEISMQYIQSRHWFMLLGVITAVFLLGLAPAQAATITR